VVYCIVVFAHRCIHYVLLHADMNLKSKVRPTGGGFVLVSRFWLRISKSHEILSDCHLKLT
jgi:hypothetical protein